MGNSLSTRDPSEGRQIRGTLVHNGCGEREKRGGREGSRKEERDGV